MIMIAIKGSAGDEDGEEHTDQNLSLQYRHPLRYLGANLALSFCQPLRFRAEESCSWP